MSEISNCKLPEANDWQHLAHTTLGLVLHCNQRNNTHEDRTVDWTMTSHHWRHCGSTGLLYIYDKIKHTPMTSLSATSVTTGHYAHSCPHKKWHMYNYTAVSWHCWGGM